jgi:hypothetical protein
LHQNSLLKHVFEGEIDGRIEVTGRRRRRCRQLLDDLKEKRGYFKLKEEALDCILGEITLEEAVDLPYNRLQNE